LCYINSTTLLNRKNSMNKSLVIVISGVIALSISTASIAAKRDDSGSAVVKTKPVAE